MHSKQRLQLRVIATVLCATFLAQELQAAPITASLTNRMSPQEQLLKQPEAMDVPLDFAQLSEVHRGSKDVFIIHIQDAHSNVSGQQNLASSLDALMSKYGIRLILSEGGEGDCSLTSIKKVASRDVWKRVAKSFLLKGEIQGEEYLNLTSDHPMKIVGVEDMSLYDVSLSNYAELAERREKAVNHLQKINTAVEKLKNRLYPKEFNNYETMKKKESGFERTFPELMRLRMAAGLENAGSESAQLFEVMGKEAALNFGLANLERAALLEELHQRGKSEELEAALGRDRKVGKNKTALLAHFEKTLNIARENGIDSSKYENLNAYMDYLRAFSAIEMDVLLTELEAEENELYEKSLEGDAELVRGVDRFITLLRSAHEIKMTTAEHERFKNAEADFGMVSIEGFLNRKLAEQGYFDDLVPSDMTLGEARKAIDDFYDSVSKRDEAFIGNVEKSLAAENQKIAFLITGGYHTDHLKKLLKESGFGYAVLTPIVTSETNQKKYESLLLSQKRPNAPTTFSKTASTAASDGVRLMLAAQRGFDARLMSAANTNEEAIAVPKKIAGARLSAEGDAENAAADPYENEIFPVLDQALSTLSPNAPRVLIIAGLSGAGKTTLTDGFKDYLTQRGAAVAIFYTDDYLRRLKGWPKYLRLLGIAFRKFAPWVTPRQAWDENLRAAVNLAVVEQGGVELNTLPAGTVVIAEGVYAEDLFKELPNTVSLFLDAAVSLRKRSVEQRERQIGMNPARLALQLLAFGVGKTSRGLLERKDEFDLILNVSDRNNPVFKKTLSSGTRLAASCAQPGLSLPKGSLYAAILAATFAITAYTVLSASGTYLALISSPVVLVIVLVLTPVFLIKILSPIMAIFWSWFTAKPPPPQPYAIDDPSLPVVTVQIPVRNEPMSKVRMTVESALSLRYPKGKIQIQLIDNSDAFPEELARYSLEREIDFIHRDGVEGFKAGNLNIGRADRRFKGEFVLILDADSLVEEDSLLKALPEFKNEDLGYAQFHIATSNEHSNLLTFVLGFEKRIYDKVQAVTDRFGFTSFMGHNGLIRVAALDAVGGWEAEISEDLATAVNMRLAGYDARYLPYVLSSEEAVETYSQATKQRARWASGTSRVFVRKLMRVLSSGKLTWYEKADFINQATSYLTVALAFLAVFLFVPYPIWMAAGIIGVGYLTAVMTAKEVKNPVKNFMPAMFFFAALTPRIFSAAVAGLVARELTFNVTVKNARKTRLPDGLRQNFVGISAGAIYAASLAGSWALNGELSPAEIEGTFMPLILFGSSAAMPFLSGVFESKKAVESPNESSGARLASNESADRISKAQMANQARKEARRRQQSDFIADITRNPAIRWGEGEFDRAFIEPHSQFAGLYMRFFVSPTADWNEAHPGAAARLRKFQMSPLAPKEGALGQLLVSFVQFAPDGEAARPALLIAEIQERRGYRDITEKDIPKEELGRLDRWRDAAIMKFAEYAKVHGLTLLVGPRPFFPSRVDAKGVDLNYIRPFERMGWSRIEGKVLNTPYNDLGEYWTAPTSGARLADGQFEFRALASYDAPTSGDSLGSLRFTKEALEAMLDWAYGADGKSLKTKDAVIRKITKEIWPAEKVFWKRIGHLHREGATDEGLERRARTVFVPSFENVVAHAVENMFDSYLQMKEEYPDTGDLQVDFYFTETPDQLDFRIVANGMALHNAESTARKKDAGLKRFGGFGSGKAIGYANEIKFGADSALKDRREALADGVDGAVFDISVSRDRFEKLISGARLADRITPEALLAERGRVIASLKAIDQDIADYFEKDHSDIRNWSSYVRLVKQRDFDRARKDRIEALLQKMNVAMQRTDDAAVSSSGERAFSKKVRDLKRSLVTHLNRREYELKSIYRTKIWGWHRAIESARPGRAETVAALVMVRDDMRKVLGWQMGKASKSFIQSRIKKINGMLQEASEPPAGARLASRSELDRRQALKAFMGGLMATTPLLQACSPQAPDSAEDPPSVSAPPLTLFGRWDGSHAAKLRDILGLFAQMKSMAESDAISAEDAEAVFTGFYSSLFRLIDSPAHRQSIDANTWDSASVTLLFENLSVYMASLGALLLYNGVMTLTVGPDGGPYRNFTARNLVNAEVLLNGETSSNGVPVAFSMRGEPLLAQRQGLGVTFGRIAVIFLPRIEELVATLSSNFAQLNSQWPGIGGLTLSQAQSQGLALRDESDSVAFAFARLLASKPSSEWTREFIEEAGLHEGQHVSDADRAGMDEYQIELRARLKSFAERPWAGLIDSLQIAYLSQATEPWMRAQKNLFEAVLDEVLDNPSAYGVTIIPGLPPRLQAIAQIDRVAVPSRALDIARRVAVRLGEEDVMSGARLAEMFYPSRTELLVDSFHRQYKLIRAYREKSSLVKVAPSWQDILAMPTIEVAWFSVDESLREMYAVTEDPDKANALYDEITRQIIQMIQDKRKDEVLRLMRYQHALFLKEDTMRDSETPFWVKMPDAGDTRGSVIVSSALFAGELTGVLDIQYLHKPSDPSYDALLFILDNGESRVVGGDGKFYRVVGNPRVENDKYVLTMTRGGERFEFPAYGYRPTTPMGDFGGAPAKSTESREALFLQRKTIHALLMLRLQAALRAQLIPSMPDAQEIARTELVLRTLYDILPYPNSAQATPSFESMVQSTHENLKLHKEGLPVDTDIDRMSRLDVEMILASMLSLGDQAREEMAFDFQYLQAPLPGLNEGSLILRFMGPAKERTLKGVTEIQVFFGKTRMDDLVYLETSQADAGEQRIFDSQGNNYSVERISEDGPIKTLILKKGDSERVIKVINDQIVSDETSGARLALLDPEELARGLGVTSEAMSKAIRRVMENETMLVNYDASFGFHSEYMARQGELLEVLIQRHFSSGGEKRLSSVHVGLGEQPNELLQFLTMSLRQLRETGQTTAGWKIRLAGLEASVRTATQAKAVVEYALQKMEKIWESGSLPLGFNKDTIRDEFQAAGIYMAAPGAGERLPTTLMELFGEAALTRKIDIKAEILVADARKEDSLQDARTALEQKWGEPAASDFLFERNVSYLNDMADWLGLLFNDQYQMSSERGMDYQLARILHGYFIALHLLRAFGKEGGHYLHEPLGVGSWDAEREHRTAIFPGTTRITYKDLLPDRIPLTYLEEWIGNQGTGLLLIKDLPTASTMTFSGMVHAMRESSGARLAGKPQTSSRRQKLLTRLMRENLFREDRERPGDRAGDGLWTIPDLAYVLHQPELLIRRDLSSLGSEVWSSRLIRETVDLENEIVISQPSLKANGVINWTKTAFDINKLIARAAARFERENDGRRPSEITLKGVTFHRRRSMNQLVWAVKKADLDALVLALTVKIYTGATEQDVLFTRNSLVENGITNARAVALWINAGIDDALYQYLLANPGMAEPAELEIEGIRIYRIWSGFQPAWAIQKPEGPEQLQSAVEKLLSVSPHWALTPFVNKMVREFRKIGGVEKDLGIAGKPAFNHLRQAVTKAVQVHGSGAAAKREVLIMIRRASYEKPNELVRFFDEFEFSGARLAEVPQPIALSAADPEKIADGVALAIKALEEKAREASLDFDLGDLASDLDQAEHDLRSNPPKSRLQWHELWYRLDSHQSSLEAAGLTEAANYLENEVLPKMPTLPNDRLNLFDAAMRLRLFLEEGTDEGSSDEEFTQIIIDDMGNALTDPKLVNLGETRRNLTSPSKTKILTPNARKFLAQIAEFVPPVLTPDRDPGDVTGARLARRQVVQPRDLERYSKAIQTILDANPESRLTAQNITYKLFEMKMRVPQETVTSLLMMRFAEYENSGWVRTGQEESLSISARAKKTLAAPISNPNADKLESLGFSRQTALILDQLGVENLEQVKRLTPAQIYAVSSKTSAGMDTVIEIQNVMRGGKAGARLAAETVNAADEAAIQADETTKLLLAQLYLARKKGLLGITFHMLFDALRRNAAIKFEERNGSVTAVIYGASFERVSEFQLDEPLAAARQARLESSAPSAASLADDVYTLVKPAEASGRLGRMGKAALADLGTNIPVILPFTIEDGMNESEKKAILLTREAMRTLYPKAYFEYVDEEGGAVPGMPSDEVLADVREKAKRVSIDVATDAGIGRALRLGADRMVTVEPADRDTQGADALPLAGLFIFAILVGAHDAKTLASNNRARQFIQGLLQTPIDDEKLAVFFEAPSMKNLAALAGLTVKRIARIAYGKILQMTQMALQALGSAA